MTEREFYIYTVKDELPRFERALSAIPTEHQDYKPDPKSKTAMELAGMMASEAAMIKIILEAGDVDLATAEKPTTGTPNEIATAFSQGLKETVDVANGMTDEAWENEARLHMGGANEWKSPKGKMAFSFLLDLIHHRGQLSTYLRAMGGKVPSIYGPSADSVE